MFELQDKFDVRVIPSRFIVSHGIIVELSKEIRERARWEEIEFLKH